MSGKKEPVEIIKPQLEIEEEIGLHKKGWVIQRIGWFLMIAVIVCGALGVFGEGWLSKQRKTAGPIEAEYERYFRYEAEMKVLVRSSGEHISNISFPQDYLKHFRIVRFVPEPENNTTRPSEIIYNFQPGHNQVVSIYMVPKYQGSIAGEMKVNSVNAIPLTHFIYP